MEQLGNIGVKIAQLRRSSGMTQEELGKRLSVSAQAVSKWENGDSLPDLSLVVQLAETYDCSTDYLLGRQGGISSIIPQIREAFARMAVEEQIGFLGEIISLAGAPMSTYHESSSGHPSLVHIHLGPTGIGLWAKERLACITTTTFLNEAIETLGKEAEFPLTLLSDDIRLVLLTLLRDMDDLKPDYAVDEKTLRTLLPDIDFEPVMTDCIELGFVDRVRGGYRLNFRSDLAVRLLAIIHQTLNKPGTMNVTVGKVN
ncbi:helix-turn-helix domain-containing protein [Paenibacillus sp. CAU 1782]